MARPSRCRRICAKPEYCSFAPEHVSKQDSTVLTLDEYETIRLIDLENMTQEQSAKQMDISRTTVMEIYNAARRKIADCIVNGKPLMIDGGNYRICDGSASYCCHENACYKRGTVINSKKQGKDIKNMIIAATYENGEVFQHFGHSEQFKIYDIEDGKIVKEQVIGTNGQGHGALADFLREQKVSALICGGIGGGAKMALSEANIEVYGGVTGSADDAVYALLNGKLIYDANVQCSHHGEAHSCGGHQCGEDKHGCAGN